MPVAAGVQTQTSQEDATSAAAPDAAAQDKQKASSWATKLYPPAIRPLQRM